MTLNHRDDALSSVLELLPGRLSDVVRRHACDKAIEEIRLRAARPVQLVFSEGETVLETAAFTAEEASAFLDRLCRHSVYAYAEELRGGYITLVSGARVGVCGRPSVENGRIAGMPRPTFFNIRIAREIPGCASEVIRLLTENDAPVSTLIAAPPGGGKTTLLRDVARCLSEGINCDPLKVAIADERGEIAACRDGVPGFDVGRRTDVMDRAPKAECISLLIRSMSPQVIVTDEIGGEGDAEAIAEAARCGTAVIASAHASCIDELLTRGCTSRLLSERVFRRVLILRRKGSALNVARVEL